MATRRNCAKRTMLCAETVQTSNIHPTVMYYDKTWNRAKKKLKYIGTMCIFDLLFSLWNIFQSAKNKSRCALFVLVFTVEEIMVRDPECSEILLLLQNDFLLMPLKKKKVSFQ